MDREEEEGKAGLEAPEEREEQGESNRLLGDACGEDSLDTGAFLEDPTAGLLAVEDRV